MLARNEKAFDPRNVASRAILLQLCEKVTFVMNHDLQPRMSAPEISLFRESLAGVRNYFEFGVGGSTVAAWKYCTEAGIEPTFYGVDTDVAWIEKVRHMLGAPAGLHLEHVDLGPVGSWGYPVHSRPNSDAWPRYPLGITRCPHPEHFDLILIDGRFRVACVIQTLLACSANAKILIHDYSNRPEYHVIEPWVETLAVADTLRLFRKAPLSTDGASELHRQFQHYWKIAR
jgi:hypothetical protein